MYALYSDFSKLAVIITLMGMKNLSQKLATSNLQQMDDIL